MSDKVVREHTLANGLKLLGEYSPHNQSAAIGFFVRTGSRDEVGREAGVSHFLEHMMFKGTPTRSAIDITFQLGNIGAQANAFTSEENTVYYSVVVPEYFSKIQELLSDMMRPAMDPAEFATEKNVILEEIALYQDRPQFYLFETALEDYFAGHPAGNSVLGSTKSITEVTRDEMAQYFEKRYSPSNMVLVASGRFDWDQFVSDAEKYCGQWRDFPASRETTRYAGVAKQKTLKKANIHQNHVLLVTEGPSAQDPERYPLGILSVILGDSSGSKLYWDLVQSGLAEMASADTDERDGAGCFSAYAATEAKNLDQVADRLKHVLSRPLEFSEADLSRAKTKLVSRMVSSGELPMGRLMSLGTEWTYRREIHNLRGSIERIRSVTRQEIESALKRFPLTTWSEYRLVSE